HGSFDVTQPGPAEFEVAGIDGDTEAGLFQGGQESRLYPGLIIRVVADVDVPFQSGYVRHRAAPTYYSRPDAREARRPRRSPCMATSAPRGIVTCMSSPSQQPCSTQSCYA